MPEFTAIEAAIRRMLEDPSTSKAKQRHLERILLEIEAARREAREAATDLTPTN